MFLNDGIGDEDENDDDAVGDRESDWRATSLDVNSAGHQIKETATDDSAGGWDRVQFQFLPTLGMPPFQKSAVFLNIVQKAFDPPPLLFEHLSYFAGGVF